MNDREQLAKYNGMTIEFVNWFFDNKKDGCGNAWFIMMAAMWEGWSALEAKCAALAAELEAAEKRIAELEARVVVLPHLISIEGGAYCTAHARYDEDGDYYYRDEVIESLLAAGIITKVGE